MMASKTKLRKALRAARDTVSEVVSAREDYRKAIAREIDHLREQLAYIAALADTGSQEHKLHFGETGPRPVAGWRVAELMREKLLDLAARG